MISTKQVGEMIRAAGLCLQCGRFDGNHSLLCPLHDEKKCPICREPAQYALDLTDIGSWGS